MVTNGQYYLVTTNDWFAAPDGELYTSAWGKCQLFEMKDVFGFIPLRPSTNWYLKIGDGENSIIIAGCHIHYAVQCSVKPNLKTGMYIHEFTKVDTVINRIYFTE